MNRTAKILIVAGLAVMAAVVFAIKESGKSSSSESGSDDSTTAERTSNAEETSAGDAEPMPLLLDLGAGKCIPCKAMKPILGDLEQNYSGTFETRFVDVWENPDEAKKYNVNIIPTQIFFDAQGNELFRHEGFYSKEDILGKWEEFGIESE